MYSITTYWSSNNMIAERKLQEALSHELQKKWKSQRYRRLVYYFFEKEIKSDLTTQLSSDFMMKHNVLLDPEYQSCIARSGLSNLGRGALIWSECTVLINNYIFRQDIFAVGSDDERNLVLHNQIIELLQQGGNPGFLDSSANRMSDILLQSSRMRADIDLVQAICKGEYTYQSLLKACGEYVGTYACLPFFFSALGLSRSTESLYSVLEVSSLSLLQPLLSPSYEIVCCLLSSDEVKAYGHISVLKTPYATWLGVLGYRRSRTPWYVKVCCSLVIVWLSGLLGGYALFVLPVVWGFLTITRSISQYLDLLQGFLVHWYTQYSLYAKKYLSIYEELLDSDESSDTVISAQKMMNRRYDVIPFSGHELVWDATQYAKTLFDAIVVVVSRGGSGLPLKELAMISSVEQRSKDNNLSLIVVQDGQYTEQVLYRFEGMLFLIRSLVPDLTAHSSYQENYEIIDDLIATKKYKFWIWSLRSAFVDGVRVAGTSGILGWIGSYLRNRGVTGSSAFAATPSLTTHTLLQSDPQFLLDPVLLEKMHAVMKPEDIDLFVHALRDDHAANLWDTMVTLFGHQQGNTYTNDLMDVRWRVNIMSGKSVLFSSAIEHDLPVASTDIGWTKMIAFLHRVYGYDNLQQYETLIDKPWLSETLSGLKHNTLSLEQFEQLDIKQREIVTQAMFYSIPKEEVSGLLIGFQSDVVDGVQSGHIDQNVSDLGGDVVGVFVDNVSSLVLGFIHHISSLWNEVLLWADSTINIHDILINLTTQVQKIIDEFITKIQGISLRVSSFTLPIVKKDKTIE